MADQTPVKDRKVIWRHTWSSYDVMSGDEECPESHDFPERGNFLYNTIMSKRKALSLLRTCLEEFPNAYLVKVMRTRAHA